MDILAHVLFLDFNVLMNIELPYRYTPEFVYGENSDKMTNEDYIKCDNLAKLMLDPDKNFDFHIREKTSLLENEKTQHMLRFLK